MRIFPPASSLFLKDFLLFIFYFGAVMTVCSASINWQPLKYPKSAELMQSLSAVPFMWALDLLKQSSPVLFNISKKKYLRYFPPEVSYKFIFAIMKSVPCSHIMYFRISRKITWPFGLCLMLRLTLQGIWLQMKHSCWHQNWQVRNICALSVSWQIGHCGDGG